MLLNINRNLFQSFPFHLVTISPWPILVSFSLLNLTLGAVLSMHGYGDFTFVVGLASTGLGMLLWFRDIILEATYLGCHTTQVQKGLTIGVILFIVSEVFAFLSVFWAFFHSSLSPSVEIGGVWPPQGIEALSAFGIPLLNTFLLLSSGSTITYGHHALIKGDRKKAIIGGLLTIILAIVFTALQYIEYFNATFTITDSVFGTTFYASTGLHGIHVIIGTIFITVGFFRIINYHLTNSHHIGYEASILYWHFVDVVWLFRAPLWIFIGSTPFIILLVFYTTTALVGSIMDYGTLVAAKLSKSTSLSDPEMGRGVQHAGKAEVGLVVYGLLRDKIGHGSTIVFGGTPQNPLSIAIIIIIFLTGNIRNIAAIITSRIFNYTKHEPKTNNTNGESIKGFPKGSNSYGNGVLILGNRKGSHLITKVGQRSLSTSAIAVKDPRYLNGGDLLLKMKVRNGKYYGLYKLICDEDVLFGAYHSMKSNPGNMTPGVDDQTLDGMSKSQISRLASDLRREIFQFKPSKRVWIPKTNGKMRPLGIPSPVDKIVQKAMAILLQLIYEPEFSKFSHGFRPKRGCHTAMRQISQWSGTQWAIEGDIKGFFDNVDHHILADLLQKRIGDQQFIDLYWKLVKAGYVEEGVKRDSLLGVPQGGIVSPILSNIYLHEFDKYVETLINKFSSTAKDITKSNPVYDKFTRRIQYLRDKYPIPQQRSLEVLEEIETLKDSRRKVPSRLPNGTRVRYVRYADDWVVGIYGPGSFANEIKSLLATFLTQELKLELSNEKTKITNLWNDKASFLGFYFMVYKPKESKFTVYQKDGHIRRAKIGHNRIWLLVPVDKILSKLSINGFLKNYKPKSKIIPNAKTNWIFLDQHSILSRYNTMIRGLLNYYSVANNRYIFHLIVNFILRHSCAKTLARKFNLRSRAKVFAKFGKNLTINNPKMSFLKEPHYRRATKWPAHTNLSNPFDVLNWQLRTQNNFWEPCLICGSTQDIEMHHVKHIRKSNKVNQGFTKIMSSLNRKQVPVCQLCHVKIHKGEYDGIGIKELMKNKRS